MCFRPLTSIGHRAESDCMREPFGVVAGEQGVREGGGGGIVEDDDTYQRDLPV